MLKGHNLQILVTYRNNENDVSVVVRFKDIDGATCDSVSLSSFRGIVNIYWGIPGNKSFENAELYNDAINLVVEAAKIIKSGRRLEDVWGSEVAVTSTQQIVPLDA